LCGSGRARHAAFCCAAVGSQDGTPVELELAAVVEAAEVVSPVVLEASDETVEDGPGPLEVPTVTCAPVVLAADVGPAPPTPEPAEPSGVEQPRRARARSEERRMDRIVGHTARSRRVFP
jgi:hypothetical protein